MAFSVSLQEPTEKFSLIQWDRIARLCSAFNYLKGVTRRKMRVRKSRFSHITLPRTALEMPQLSYKVIQCSEMLLFSFFLTFNHCLTVELVFFIVSKPHQYHRSCNSLKVYSLSKASLLSFSILQMNQRTSDDSQLLLQHEL